MMTPVRGAGTAAGACADSDIGSGPTASDDAGAIAIAGVGAAIAAVGGGGAGAALSVGTAMRSSGVRQTKPSSVPDGRTGPQRPLIPLPAPQALSRGARAAPQSHSSTAPLLPSASSMSAISKQTRRVGRPLDE